MRQFTRGRKEGQAAAGNYAGWENIQAWPAPAISKSRLPVNIPALLHKLYRLLFHTFAECGLLVYAFFRGEVAHVLGDFHRAETRAAHRAEVRDLAGFPGHGLVVEFARLVRGVEAEVELVFPAEFEARQCGFCRCFYALKRNY